jgi:hypothetical protein
MYALKLYLSYYHHDFIYKEDSRIKIIAKFVLFSLNITLCS